MDPEVWKLIAQIGVPVAALIWVIFHLLTKTLPAITKEHNESVTTIVDRFSGTIDTQNQNFKATMTEQREATERMTDRYHKSLDDNTNVVREISETISKCRINSG